MRTSGLSRGFLNNFKLVFTYGAKPLLRAFKIKLWNCYPTIPFDLYFFFFFSYFTGTCLLKVHALCMMLVASHDRNCNNNLSIIRSINPKFPLAKRCYRGFVQEAEHLGSVGWPLAQRPAVSAWLLSGPWWEGCSVDNLPISSRNNDERGWQVCMSLHIMSSLVISIPWFASSASGNNTSPMTFCLEYTS